MENSEKGVIKSVAEAREDVSVPVIEQAERTNGMLQVPAKQPKNKKLKQNGWLRDIVMNKWLYILAIPVVLFFLIFNYLPMFGLIMAFEDFRPARGFFGSDWIGFQNFADFFGRPEFWTILRNTFAISGLGLVVTFPLTILFALSLNEVTVLKLKKVFQTISYVPYFISTVVVCQLVREFCTVDGLFTDIVVSFGAKRENLLTNPAYFWGINLFSEIWQNLGYGSIVFIAAITGVNGDLHEAAVLDGANRLQRVWHVTIPGIMPTIITMLVLKCGMIMSVGYDKILLLYNETIYSTADVISTHVQRWGIERMQYGYAAAVGLFNSVVATIFLLVSNWISKKAANMSVF